MLFDGKTTSGWVTPQGKPVSKGWQVAEGLLSTKSGDRGGDIVTQNEYSNFILTLDFNIERTCNSGVKYFYAKYAQGGNLGFEYQILDDAKHPDAKQGVVGNRTLSSLYDLIPPYKTPRAYRKIGEWNLGRVVVYPDNRIEHYLNGYKMVEYQRGTPIFYALVARSKYVQWENFGMAPAGHILLQDHGDQVSFKNIKIKKLN